jgi:hypothetical protein
MCTWDSALIYVQEYSRFFSPNHLERKETCIWLQINAPLTQAPIDHNLDTMASSAWVAKTLAKSVLAAEIRVGPKEESVGLES